MNVSLRLVSSLMIALSLSSNSMGGVIVFSAFDDGANSADPRPNSAAKAAQFDVAASALGSLSVIDFESAPLGSFASLTIAPGVTVSGVGASSFAHSIRNTPDGSPDAQYGYNTTAAGARFAYMRGGSMTFTFGSGVQAFGAFISGIQFTGETITFDDGSTQSLTIPGLDFLRAGIAFVGFTDAGKSITSISINGISSIGQADFLGIDDVRYVAAGAATAVPEPSTLSAGLVAVLGGCLIARKRPASGSMAYGRSE